MNLMTARHYIIVDEETLIPTGTEGDACPGLIYKKFGPGTIAVMTYVDGKDVWVEYKSIEDRDLDWIAKKD